MNIELTSAVEEQLRAFAAKAGRDVGVVVEEAIQYYLDSVAITDLDSAAVAEAQIALLAELPDVSEWKASDA